MPRYSDVGGQFGAGLSAGKGGESRRLGMVPPWTVFRAELEHANNLDQAAAPMRLNAGLHAYKERLTAAGVAAPTRDEVTARNRAPCFKSEARSKRFGTSPKENRYLPTVVDAPLLCFGTYHTSLSCFGTARPSRPVRLFSTFD
jgi:hypothetical protein